MTPRLSRSWLGAAAVLTAGAIDNCAAPLAQWIKRGDSRKRFLSVERERLNFQLVVRT